MTNGEDWSGNEPSPADARLSRIETLWSVVRRAHEDDRAESSSAQQQLLAIYGGAIRRYLVGAVRNDDLADELFQEFACKFLRGELKSADPQRGKFRSFVKTVLFRLVALYFRKANIRKETSFDAWDAVNDQPSTPQDDGELFLLSWREDVLNRTWEALATQELAGGPPYNTVLRTKVQNATANSMQLAELMSGALGKSISSGNARVMVHRARDRFADLLIETVAESLETPTRENIEAELVELRLIDYCRQSLEA